MPSYHIRGQPVHYLDWNVYWKDGEYSCRRGRLELDPPLSHDKIQGWDYLDHRDSAAALQTRFIITNLSSSTSSITIKSPLPFRARGSRQITVVQSWVDRIRNKMESGRIRPHDILRKHPRRRIRGRQRTDLQKLD